MTRFGCLIFLLVIVCPSLQEKGSRSVPQVNQNANLQCYSSCDQRYPPSRTDTWLACHRGCRLASMLSRLASGKQKKEVAKSCLAACSEAYNDTQDETACHSGCGHTKPEKTASMKARAANNKSIDAGTRKQKDEKKKVMKMPSPNHPDTIPANRILWAKTVVDEQDVDSSSDETISFSDFFPSLSNPLSLISRIWPKNLLIPGIKISKSTVTYVSEQEPATPDAEPAIKSEVSQSFSSKSDPVAKSAVDVEIPVKPVHPSKQQQDENQKPPEFLKPTEKPAAVEIKVNPAVDPFYPMTATGLLGQLELLVIVLLISISVSFLVILLMLHCATGQRDYSPVSTSDNEDAKDDEGQRLVSTSCTSDDEREEASGRQNSLYSRLIYTGLLPPSYEEAQQHRNDKNQSSKQPLLLALDV